MHGRGNGETNRTATPRRIKFKGQRNTHCTISFASNNLRQPMVHDISCWVSNHSAPTWMGQSSVAGRRWVIVCVFYFFRHESSIKTRVNSSLQQKKNHATVIIASTKMFYQHPAKLAAYAITFLGVTYMAAAPPREYSTMISKNDEKLIAESLYRHYTQFFLCHVSCVKNSIWQTRF